MESGIKLLENGNIFVYAQLFLNGFELVDKVYIDGIRYVAKYKLDRYQAEFILNTKRGEYEYIGPGLPIYESPGERYIAYNRMGVVIFYIKRDKELYLVINTLLVDSEYYYFKYKGFS